MEIGILQQWQFSRADHWRARPVLCWVYVAGVVVLVLVGATAERSPTAANAPSVRTAGIVGNAELGPAWASLSASQRATLAPLQGLWPKLESSRKQRWLGVAARLRGRPDSVLSRVHARMKAWASLTPQDRASARLRYVIARHAEAAKLERSGNALHRPSNQPMRRPPVDSQLVPVVPASVRVGPGATTVLLTEFFGSQRDRAEAVATPSGPS